MNTVELPVALLQVLGWIVFAIIIGNVVLITVVLNAGRDTAQQHHNAGESEIKNKRADILIGVNAGLKVVHEFVLSMQATSFGDIERRVEAMEKSLHKEETISHE